MSAEAIVAIVAAAIALGALYSSWRTTKSAALTAQAATEQTEIQRQLRMDSSQPYVWADLRPDDATGTLINLVIGNSGPTIATNVRVSFDPSLNAIQQLRDRAQAAQRVLSQGLKSLPPGRVYTWPIGQGFNLLQWSEVRAYNIVIDFEGPFGPVPTLEYVVDMAALEGVLDRPAGSVHQLTIAVRDLAKSLPDTCVMRESREQEDYDSE
jgi:hypothetical protein